MRLTRIGYARAQKEALHESGRFGHQTFPLLVEKLRAHVVT